MAEIDVKFMRADKKTVKKMGSKYTTGKKSGAAAKKKAVKK